MYSSKIIQLILGLIILIFAIYPVFGDLSGWIVIIAAAILIIHAVVSKERVYHHNYKSVEEPKKGRARRKK